MIRAQALAHLTAPGQAYELVELEIRGSRQRVFKNAPACLRDLYAGNLGDETFYVYEDERLSYAEAWRRAAKIAVILRDRYGVAKGDRVAISMRNYPEWVQAFMAITSLGAIAVAMNALWQPAEMAYGLKNCGAKVLLADQERLNRFAQIAEEVEAQVIAVRPTKAAGDWTHLAGLVENLDDVDMPVADIAPDDNALIIYTSGSTGHPKGAVSTHRNVVSALLSWELDLQAGALMSGLEPAPPAWPPATLLGVPLFHVMGSHVIFLASYRSRRKIVSMYKWDPVVAAELIERERITAFSAPPAMTGDMVRVAAETRADLSSLLSVGGGGAARAPEQVKQIDAAFASAVPGTGWGMTETNAIGVGISGGDYLERPTSSGRVSAVLDIKIVDENGATAPAGERGELLIRGASIFVGYWNRPEVNTEVFTDGWFRTGDVATLDDEGFLYIVDRIKDLIIRGGENIGCGQVEAALLAHPDVHEAAVYSVPDERLGEEVGATIHANPGLELAALDAFLRERLAGFEVPRYVSVSSEPLPRTASGKIFKRQLRDEVIAGLKTGEIV